jgi:hypothetical protein
MCLPHLAFAFPPPTTPYQAHTDLHIVSPPPAIVSLTQPTTINPTTVYLKVDSMLKLQPCPEDPKDFPAYEKKVRASLRKFNMHHLLDDGTVTTDDNCDVSVKLASALMLSFKTKHIKWFMGEYEDHDIKMWQYLRAKVLDEDDKDELYNNKLLHPKMKSDESPLDYQLTIEQAL